MDVPVDTVVLVGAICAIIGFLLSQLFNSLFSAPKPGAGDSGGDEKIKVLRKKDEDNLFIELDGHPYAQGDHLNGEQRNQLNRLILEINDWLSRPYPSKPKKHVDHTGDQGITQHEEVEDTTPRLNFNPVTMMVKALQADVKQSQLPTESLITQIDEILQEKLLAAPDITDPVRLMEWPDKGMVVMVGMKKYEGVDEVPDQNIKAIIQSAVKEWEQRIDDESAD
jgi:hypothetical protein